MIRWVFVVFGSNTMIQQYDTCDYTVEACQRIATELRESGKYKRVTVRRKAPGRNGAGVMCEFGRIYVEDHPTPPDTAVTMEF